MPLTKSIENWLYSVLQPQYLNKQITYSHVHHFLVAHLKKGHDFRIRTAVHTSVRGHPQLLINLYGVINVESNLSVPVSIWVPWEYPFGDIGVPIVYVTADHSQNWFLRPTNNVDSVGKFYHPYLTEWSSMCINEEIHSFSKFNLTALLDLVASTVSMQDPIYQGSLALPPRPTPRVSQQVSSDSGHVSRVISSPNPQGSGENLHTARASSIPVTSKDNIPARYASPLPLPVGIMETQINGRNAQPYSERKPSLRYSTGQNSPESSSNSFLQNTPQSFEQRPLPNENPSCRTFQAQEYVRTPPPIPHSQQIKGPQNKLSSEECQVCDIMDSAPKIAATATAQHTRLLEELVLEIDTLLPQMPVNMVAAEVNIHRSRSHALHSQLSHHNRQAQANAQNLTEISNDLLMRIEAATALNTTLVTVVAENAKTPNAICTEPGHSLDLDELIVADSPIVTQLYEVVLEIKACKDTIKLLDGSFKGHSELISDKNLRQCVKQARSIARDLFWLEITKKEILLRINQG